MNVMLLAAGEGTRLRPYTMVLPKPAIPFLTIPLAAHALSFLNGNIDKLVVNTFHLPTKIHELFHQIPHGARTLFFSDEVGEIFGGGGGLGKARHHFVGGGDFVMMNADEVILPKDNFIFKKAMEHHRQSKALATIMVMEHPGVGSQFGGVWADSKNRVLGFGKSSFSSSKGWHFVGALILSEKVFDYIPTAGASNILYDVLTAAMAKGELVQALPFVCEWFETGNPQDFFKASEKCFQFLTDGNSSFQKEALLNTFKRFSSESIQIEKTGAAWIVKSESAVIENSADLEGLIVVGKNSRICGPSILKNVVISSNVRVPASTKASDTIFLEG